MGQSSSSQPSHGGDMLSSFEKFYKDFKMESKIISQEAINSIQSSLKAGDLQSAGSVINNALRDINNAPLSIAVIGETGTGKSSFINAIRRLGNEEEGAAPAGFIGITMERKKYEHPKLPNVTLWELPGIGPFKFPPHEYLEKMKFREYDFFIIISATRFKTSDAQLCSAIKKMKKNFYFVRTKIDCDLHNIKMFHPNKFNEQEILEKIHNDCVNNLKKANVSDPQVFLISSFQLANYDFPRLDSTLVRDLPEHKRHIFMQYLPNITEATIDGKRESLRKKVWLEAMRAGASAFVPMMGYISDKDMETLKDTLTLYRVYFGLDDSSLKMIAKDLDVSVEKLKENLNFPHLLSAEKDEKSLGEKLWRYVENFCSVSGGPIASGIYFNKIFYLQNFVLETVASDAKVLLKNSHWGGEDHPDSHSLLLFPLSQRGSSDLASGFDKFFKNFKPESKILSQETIALIETHLKAGDIPRVPSVISDALRDIDIAPVNIVVTGEPGTGKSSFINALQGVRHNEEGASPTRAVETTLERIAYKNPKLPNVTFWDLPGMMTITFQPQKYLKKMKFGEYDFFIIISSTCFKINDAHLAEAIRRMKNFYFVRTKVDSDLHSAKISKPSAFNKDEILQRVRSDCVTQLENANMGGTQVFLIPSFDLSDYDFPHLETTFLRELPAHKCHIFMQYLPNVMEAAIDRKRDSLKQKVWLEALMAGASATISFLGFISDNDVEKLEETLTLYRSYFGLDDSSLETIAKDLHVSAEKLKANLTSPHLLSAEKGPIASGIYFRKIFYLQNYFLETVVNDAKVLLKKQVIFKDPVESGQSYLPQDVRNENWWLTGDGKWGRNVYSF
uniref:IRG-type G domain-containing protein n=1 Tax=Neovison vison TaxID=452646 RepID=A0A8C7EM32_NEOVI